MHGRRYVCTAAGGLAVLCVALIWTGCATAPPANVKMVDCQGAAIDWDVAPEAEIVDFACAMGTHGKDPALNFKVRLKNAAQEPLRFRLGVYLLDMDKAVAYLVPTKGKPPRLAPGQEATVTIPFIKTTAMAKKIMVRVAPMSSE
jgi:hypothetical protein